MSFAAPYLLLGLLAVPVAALGYVLLERRREGRAASWATPALMPNLVDRPSPRRRLLPGALFLFGLMFLLVGFARPEVTINSVREGATVVLTIDDSGSMAAKDVKPTRLVAARKAVFTLLQGLPKQYRVSLVTFTDHPAVLVPPTYDRDKVRAALPTKAMLQGTAVGDAIAASVKVAVQAVGPNRPGSVHASAAIILLSDGSSTVREFTPPTVAAKRARAARVPVSTVVLGTPNGKVTQSTVAPGGFKQTRTLPAPADPTTLHSIALATGGRFYQATTAAQLQQIYRDLGSHQAHQHKRHEITAAATGIALAFILVGVIFSGIWFRRVA